MHYAFVVKVSAYLSFTVACNLKVNYYSLLKWMNTRLVMP